MYSLTLRICGVTLLYILGHEGNLLIFSGGSTVSAVLAELSGCLLWTFIDLCIVDVEIKSAS